MRFATKTSEIRPKSKNSLLISLLAGNWLAGDASAQTASTTTQSCATPVSWRRRQKCHASLWLRPTFSRHELAALRETGSRYDSKYRCALSGKRADANGDADPGLPARDSNPSLERVVAPPYAPPPPAHRCLLSSPAAAAYACLPCSWPQTRRRAPLCVGRTQISGGIG
jgi:hypothetical protein